MSTMTVVTYIEHGKKTLEITSTKMNEPSAEALRRAAARIRLI